MSNFQMAEYIWLDGAEPTRFLRSKARVVNVGDNPKPEDFPEWSYDGSSTNQAEGGNSDCILKPVYFTNDPIRGGDSFLVMCEVFNPDGSPHESNSRAQLRAVYDAGADKHEMWMGLEQEYVLMNGRTPLGWPEQGYPGPQGPYYCGVGSEEIFGREMVEEHTRLCLETDIMLYGINAEVMPGQWEFQIGYRGDKTEDGCAMKIADQTWLARWLLYRVGEEYGINVTLDNKPVKGDWNGSGMHANISTKAMREKGGMDVINSATAKMESKHAEHIALYGADLGERLTGAHETCDINTFKVGTADRGCSIRIPQQVAQKGYGYFEDRRPGANADPYLVAARIATTICDDVPESVMTFTSWPCQKKPKIAVAAE